ncbi:hypothetical protein [Micromonospora sp. NBC_01412]|uniref:hypothetical protein n=1 Tax=Micromonospora sp. NBC_01412 TaxID=2903590 RepID=UPI003248E37B
MATTRIDGIRGDAVDAWRRGTDRIGTWGVANECSTFSPADPAPPAHPRDYARSGERGGAGHGGR